MKFPFLFTREYTISLIDCRLDPDSRILTVQLSRFERGLNPGKYTIKENAIWDICDIWLPEWAISSEPLIFLQPIELEVANAI